MRGIFYSSSDGINPTLHAKSGQMLVAATTS